VVAAAVAKIALKAVQAALAVIIAAAVWALVKQYWVRIALGFVAAVAVVAWPVGRAAGKRAVRGLPCSPPSASPSRPT
jgi:hypothetical protein